MDTITKFRVTKLLQEEPTVLADYRSLVNDGFTPNEALALLVDTCREAGLL